MGFSDASFWQNFWPNFWADLVVGVIIAGLIAWVLERSKKIEAIIELNTNTLNETETQLTFSLRNSGKIAFRNEEVYWHVFIPTSLQPKIAKLYNDTAAPDAVSVVMWSENFINYRNMLRAPIFPSRRTNLFDIKVNTANIGKNDCYFFLSTAHGLFPKT